MRIQNILIAAVLGASIATPASAQLGGLMRKAKEAAAAKAVESTIGPTGKNLKASDTFGPELTEASLDGVLRGLAALEKTRDQAAQVRLEGQQLQAAYARSSSAHEKERQTFEKNHDRIGACQDSVIGTRGAAAQAAFLKKLMSDPAAQAEMVKAAADLGRMQATSTDTNAVRDAYFEMAKKQGVDPKADTVAAIKQCGSIPVKPAWLIEQDSLREQGNRAEGEARDLEYKANDDAAAAAGMDHRAFALARERLLHWYSETHGGSPIQAFGKDERKLLESRKADIEKFKNLLS